MKNRFFAAFIIALFIPQYGLAYFLDMDGSHIYSDAIEYVREEGIVDGYPDGTYRPDDIINRAEFTKIIMNARFSETLSDNCGFGKEFQDLDSAQWYTKYICTAENLGIINGYPDGTFGPAQNINFAEAAKIIVNSYGFDVVEEGPWYQSYVNILFYYNAAPDTISSYSQYLTRGEMAQMIYMMDAGEDASILEEAADEDTTTTYEESQESCRDAGCFESGTEIDYVIITRPVFTTALQDFIGWKEENGFTTGLITVDYIHDLKNMDNPSESIKEAVMDLTNSHDAEYFLLVGDTIASNIDSYYDDDYYNTDLDKMYDLDYDWNVPSGYYCRYGLYYYGPDAGDYSLCTEISDVYYADFDEGDWAENADGYIMRDNYSNSYASDAWGNMLYENPYDQSPLDFETIIGRIPIREPEEFENIFYKMKNFEPMREYNSVIEVQFDNEDLIYDTYCGGLSEEEAGEKVVACSQLNRLLLGMLDDYGIDYDPTVADLDSLEETDAAREEMLNAEGILHPEFHGNQLGLATVFTDRWTDSFDNIFAAYIVNSCAIGAYYFYNEDSFAEQIIKSDTGPAFVLNPMNRYVFMRGILEGKTVGEAFYNIGETYSYYNSIGDVLIGDPSLRIY